MKYILVIKLVYTCMHSAPVVRERVFASKEFDRAVQVYNEAKREVGREVQLGADRCVLSEVKGGHRVRK